jgi:hypothetical protein
VLTSQIEKSKKQEYDLLRAELDNLKLYINPEMFQKELEMRGMKIAKYEKTNKDFAMQSRTARLFGRPMLSNEMQKALDEFKQIQGNPNIKKTEIGPIDVSDIKEEEVLG